MAPEEYPIKDIETVHLGMAESHEYLVVCIKQKDSSAITLPGVM